MKKKKKLKDVTSIFQTEFMVIISIVIDLSYIAS